MVKSKKLSTKLFGLCSDESIISHWMILNRYLLFCVYLYSRRDERLETWLEKIENFNIPELQTYVNGIRIDINVVKNGIKLKYNNGLAEGSVNKIKVIKRIMYGRNSFDLLKAKVLLHEQFRCEFN